MSHEEKTIEFVTRELHDGTGQALTALIVGLRTLRSADTVDEVRGQAALLEGVAVRAARDLACLMRGLPPFGVDDVGLPRAIQRHVAEFSAVHDVRVALCIDGLERIETDGVLSAVVFRILQEALANVAKHAHASEVSVVMTVRDDSLRMLVDDDGDGFSMSVAPSAGSRGLADMRERVRFLGGRIGIESVPGEGCSIMVQLPIVQHRVGESSA